MRRFITGGCALLASFVVAGPAMAALDRGGRADWPLGTVVVSYDSPAALSRALAKHPAQVVRRVPALKIVAVRPGGDPARYAAALSAEAGIGSAERTSPRRSRAEPALAAGPAGGSPLQWQYAAVAADRVPADVTRAAAAFTIAVIDTGADLAAPDLAAKAPSAWSIRGGSADVTDRNGHGTFVAALAAGSSSNGDGIAGIGGDARLMVVQAGGPAGTFTDVDEAAAIVYAVDHGAKIVNLSLGGTTTSTTEQRAIDYAVAKGALLVAAVGNGRRHGSPVEYPAALLQPVGSKGVGGHGLAVAASTRSGTDAPFSSAGTHVSLAAPGEAVFSAVSTSSPEGRYPRTELPGSAGGAYGYGSGTSFAAPQVAGAAALVWAAAPGLRADQVAAILEETASGHGAWTPQLGFGVLDVAAAVERARSGRTVSFRVEGRRIGSRVRLGWPALPGAAAYHVTLSQNGGEPRQLGATATTSASYALTPGSAYAFAVTAYDAAGGPLAASQPWKVSLRQAAARLSLRADRSRLQVKRVSLAAHLRVAARPGAESGQTVVLEAFDGTTWTRAASGVTDAKGRATWRYAVEPGRYVVRVRYPGTVDVTAAMSAPVAIRIR